MLLVAVLTLVTGTSTEISWFEQYVRIRCSRKLAWLRCSEAAAFSSKVFTSGENRNDIGPGGLVDMYRILHYIYYEIKCAGLRNFFVGSYVILLRKTTLNPCRVLRYLLRCGYVIPLQMVTLSPCVHLPNRHFHTAPPMTVALTRIIDISMQLENDVVFDPPGPGPRRFCATALFALAWTTTSLLCIFGPSIPNAAIRRRQPIWRWIVLCSSEIQRLELP